RQIGRQTNRGDDRLEGARRVVALAGELLGGERLGDGVADLGGAGVEQPRRVEGTSFLRRGNQRLDRVVFQKGGVHARPVVPVLPEEGEERVVRQRNAPLGHVAQRRRLDGGRLRLHVAHLALGRRRTERALHQRRLDLEQRRQLVAVEVARQRIAQRAEERRHFLDGRHAP